MIITQLIRLLALLDALHRRHTDCNRVVQPPRPGVPIQLLGRNLYLGGASRARAGSRSKGEADLRRRTAARCVCVGQRRAAWRAGRSDTSGWAGGTGACCPGGERPRGRALFVTEEVVCQVDGGDVRGEEFGGRGRAFDNGDALAGEVVLGGGREEGGVGGVVGDAEEDVAAVVVVEMEGDVFCGGESMFLDDRDDGGHTLYF